MVYYRSMLKHLRWLSIILATVVLGGLAGFIFFGKDGNPIFRNTNNGSADSVAQTTQSSQAKVKNPKIVYTLPIDRPEKVAVSSGGMVILSIAKIRAASLADPSRPVVTGQWDSVDETDAAAMGPKRGYVIDHGYYSSIDFTDPKTPQHEKEETDSTIEAWDMRLIGSTLYTVAGYGGVQIIDVTSSTKAVPLGYIGGLRFPEAMDVTGKRVYVLDFYRGLVIYNIENPSAPVEIGRWNDNRLSKIETNSLAVSGNYAYIVTATSGLIVVDITNPSEVKEVAGLPGAIESNAMRIAGSYLFIADGKKGLLIVDIHYPQKPVLISTVLVSGEALDVAVVGKYAYVVDSDAGIAVVELGPDDLPIIGTEPRRECETTKSGFVYSEVKEECVSVTVNDCARSIGYETEEICRATHQESLTWSDRLDEDSDQDGIPGLQEAFYGSVPTKADTDGDGFSDRQEIINGYDPLGAGKMTVTLFDAYCLRSLAFGNVHGSSEGKNLPETQRKEICSVFGSLWKNGAMPARTTDDSGRSVIQVGEICLEYYQGKNDPDAREKALVCNNEGMDVMHWFFSPGPTIGESIGL